MTTPPITSWYIATVWMSPASVNVKPEDDWSSMRQVIRLPAIGPADFKVRVQQNWPNKVIDFGPVGLSRLQK